MSLENSDEQKLQLANELKDMGNSEVPIQKRSVLKNAWLLLSARENILNNFEVKVFPKKILNQKLDQQYLLHLNKNGTN